ncbi:MAG TPA: hypothetical protein VKH35_05020 [Thermoanaerobaculia bacterium]|nr:hypothetical protein [Thermoanaerobaculia bacterium]
MSRTQPKPQSVPRDEAIDLVRAELLKLTDSDRSACRVAADKGFFCRGFARYGDGELKRRYNWIYRKQPGMSREELEEIANRWQLARQEVDDLPIACDVQQMERDTCRGWDDFSNEDLARYLYELTGRAIAVV